MISEIRKIIHDAWEFFVPPTIRMLILATILLFIAGSIPFKHLADYLSLQLAGTDFSGLWTFLEKHELVSIVPLVGLWIFSVLAYLANRLVFGVAQIIPINISYSSEALIAHNPHVLLIWQHYPDLKYLAEIMPITEYTLSKIRAEGKETMLSNVVTWEKTCDEAGKMFSFIKFLFVWSFICGVIAGSIGEPDGSLILRLAFVWLILTVIGFFNLCKNVDAIAQTIHSKLAAASIFLNMQNDSPHITPERMTEIHKSMEGYPLLIEERKWWTLQLRGKRWFKVLKNYGETKWINKPPEQKP